MKYRYTLKSVNNKTLDTLIKIGAGVVIGLCGVGIGKLIYDASKEPKASIYFKMKSIVLKYRTYPIIRKIAKELINDIDRRDIINRVRRIYYYIQHEFDYLKDPYGLDFVSPPDHLIYVKGGDCDCLSVYLATLLVSVGYRTQFVFVPRHAFVRVLIPAFQENELPPNTIRWSDKRLKGFWVPLEAAAKGTEIGQVSSKVKRYLRYGNYKIVDLQ